MRLETTASAAVSFIQTPTSIAVTTPLVSLYDKANALAKELAVPFTAYFVADGFTHLLVITPERIELHMQGANRLGPLYADFVTGALAHRRRFGGGRQQPLAKAVGLKGGISPYVLDATAGLGRDGFVLACLGCKVLLVERSPIIGVLLRQGLQQAQNDPQIGSIVRERLHITIADSRTYITTLTESQRPDVVYLDPMYPHRSKTALVKKEMRMLRQLVGDDPDAGELLAVARCCARQRVVVKRPRLAPVLEGPQPTMTIFSKNTRFDVYLAEM
jgi:16S rRNA (guanine1516-N2)-methyltransferase